MFDEEVMYSKIWSGSLLFYIVPFLLDSFLCKKIYVTHQSQTLEVRKKNIPTIQNVNEQWIFQNGKYKELAFKDVHLPPCNMKMQLSVKVSSYPRKYYCGTNKPESIKTDEEIIMELVGSYSNLPNDFLLMFTYKPLSVQCGHSLFMSAGATDILTSPNFPYNYMSNASCIWQITVSDDSMAYIEIKFQSFILQRETQFGRCRDYLKLYDSKTTRESDIIGVFCGTNVPRGIRSSGNVLTIYFASDYSITAKGFEIKLTAVRSDEPLDGLQSVAAIFGGISFFVFIGLLLCSIVYKRWSRNNSEDDGCNDEATNPEDDYRDVIQAAAPPSYTAVMADPEQFPTTPADTPRSSPLLQRSNVTIADLPDIEPPDYSIAKINETKLESIEVLPPPPTYNEVSESEDEWFPVRIGTKRRPKTSRTESEQPPSYEAVTSEGSDIDASSKDHKRKPSRLKSRSQRTSVSNIAQAQRGRSTGNSDSDSENEENPKSPSRRSLSDIESSDSDENDPSQESTRLNQDTICQDNHELSPAHYNSDTTLESNSKSPTFQRLSFHLDRSSNRSSSYNDLARVAILNSSLRHNENNVNELTQVSKL